MIVDPVNMSSSLSKGASQTLGTLAKLRPTAKPHIALQFEAIFKRSLYDTTLSTKLRSTTHKVATPSSWRQRRVRRRLRRTLRMLSIHDSPGEEFQHSRSAEAQECSLHCSRKPSLSCPPQSCAQSKLARQNLRRIYGHCRRRASAHLHVPASNGSVQSRFARPC